MNKKKRLENLNKCLDKVYDLADNEAVSALFEKIVGKLLEREIKKLEKQQDVE